MCFFTWTSIIELQTLEFVTFKWKMFRYPPREQTTNISPLLSHAEYEYFSALIDRVRLQEELELLVVD